MKSTVLFILLVCFLFVPATSPYAGTLRVAEIHGEYCRLEFIGEIEKGDSEQFAKILKLAWDANISICLDSPGGSFREAVAIVDTMTYPTIVPSGAQCVGACAIVFTGGREVAGQGVIHEISSRTLLPGGRLAFHQPVPEAGDDEFADALGLAAQLSRLNRRVAAGLGNDRPFISDALLRIVLETEPEEPFMVTRVGDLIMNGISYPSIRVPHVLEMDQLRNVCAAHLMKRYVTADGWGYVNDTPDADYYETRKTLFEDGIGSMPELVGAIVPYRNQQDRSAYLGILSGFGLSDTGGGTMVTRQRMCLVLFDPNAQAGYRRLSVAIAQADDLPEAEKKSGIELHYSPNSDEQARKLAETIIAGFADPATDDLRSVDLEWVDPISMLEFAQELDALNDRVHLDGFRAGDKQYQRPIEPFAEALQ